MSRKKTRVQFELAPAAIDKLDRLVEVSGASSRNEVVRRALALFGTALDEDQHDRHLYVMSDDGKQRHKLILY